MNRRGPLGILVLLMPLLLAAGPGPSKGEVRLDARFGWGGRYREGRWTYGRITVENPSEEPVEVEVTAAVDGVSGLLRSQALFSLGPRSRKTRFVYFRPPQEIYEMKLLVGPRGRGAPWEGPVFIPQEIPILVGEASSGEGRAALRIQAAYGAVGMQRDTLQVAHVDIGQVPDRRIGLDSLDALYLPEGGKGLGPAQAGAVTRWVAAGGRLIIGGAATWKELAESPIAELLPIRPQGSRTIPAPAALEDLMGAAAEGEISLITGRITAGHVLLWDGEAPLVTRRGYGQGTVTLAAFDPMAIRSPDTDGPRELWRWLIPVDTWEDETAGLSYTPALSEIGTTLEKFAGVQPIDLVWIVVFIVAYVLVIGPIDYLVLKRVGRLEWTWFTFTGAVIVFSGIAYFGSIAIRGGSLSTREVVLVDIDPATGWRTTRSYISVHSPANREIGFSGITPDTSLSPLGVAPGGEMMPAQTPLVRSEPATLTSGPVDSLRSRMRIWTPATFRMETTDRDRPSEGTARITDDRLYLVLENPFPSALGGLLAFSGDRIYTLGPLEAGERRQWDDVGGGDLESWTQRKGYEVVPNMWSGPYPTYRYGLRARRLQDLCLHLTLASDPPEWVQLDVGEESPPRPSVELPGVSLAERIAGGGLIVLGWLEPPPAAFAAEEWAPASEERVCLVRFLIEPEEGP